MRETGPKVAHNTGRRRATDRQQPRKSKRDTVAHTDKYAKSEDDLLAEALLALAAHFNGQEADNG